MAKLTKEELFEKKEYGDVPLIAKMIKVNPWNAYKALKREGSKRHNAAIKALRKIVKAREKAIRNKTPIK